MKYELKLFFQIVVPKMLLVITSLNKIFKSFILFTMKIECSVTFAVWTNFGKYSFHPAIASFIPVEWQTALIFHTHENLSVSLIKSTFCIILPFYPKTKWQWNQCIKIEINEKWIQKMAIIKIYFASSHLYAQYFSTFKVTMLEIETE